MLLNAITNYRGIILSITYGFTFGIEITFYNNISSYFEDYFGVNIVNAGVIAAAFGLSNIFSRPFGGILSDMTGRRFGMRGRLWTLFLLQVRLPIIHLSLNGGTAVPKRITEQ